MIPEFFTASILAAFLGGAVAFFAPCCITFLLPAYFAFALKEKKQILKLTLVFMLGLATVLLPIGLGLAGLGQLASQFHTQIFVAGGLFLVLVGALTLAGRSLSMPFKPKAGNLQKLDVASVYQLGLFSGFASSCCLPVLAGVLTLSFVSASFVQAFILGWAYVLGMVIPLLVLALVWDKYHLEKKSFIQGKMFRFHFVGKKFELHSTSLFSGLILVLIGLYTLFIAFSNRITAASEYQIGLALWLQEFEKNILGAAKAIPDWFFLVLLVVGTVFLIKKATKKEGKKMDCCGNGSHKKEEGHSHADCACCKTGKATDEAVAKDLVCGMTVKTRDSPRSEYNHKEYFFCGEHCKKTFDKNPQAHAKD